MSEPAEPMGDGCWLDWGGSGPVLHFAHGNGFPPATYRRLLEVLRSSHHVVTMGRPQEVGDAVLAFLAGVSW